uniref:Uncharacterized protein n=1 Tax=Anguilla anguilla TaxID=7936 RepID=A0A0E9QQ67_ANGAN
MTYSIGRFHFKINRKQCAWFTRLVGLSI